MKVKERNELIGMGALFAGLVLILVLVLVLNSCSAGLSQEEADELKTEVQDIGDSIAAMESSLQNLVEEEELEDEAAQTLNDLREELESITSRLSDLESELDIPEPAAAEPAGGAPAGGGAPAPSGGGF